MEARRSRSRPCSKTRDRYHTESDIDNLAVQNSPHDLAPKTLRRSSFKTIHNRNLVHVRPRTVSGVLAMFSGVIAGCGNAVFQNPVPHTDQIFCAMIAGVGP